jgi:hypothetical protein
MNWPISVIVRNCRRLGSAQAGMPAIRGELSRPAIHRHSSWCEDADTDPVVNAGSDPPGSRRKRDAPCRNQSARVHDGHILPGPSATLKGPHGHGPDALASPDRISVPEDVTPPGLLASLEVIRPDTPARAFSLSGRGRLLPDRSGSNALFLAVLFCVLSAIGRSPAFPGQSGRETPTFPAPVSPEMSNAISPETPTAGCPRRPAASQPLDPDPDTRTGEMT